jgi:hypothetical protein
MRSLRLVRIASAAALLIALLTVTQTEAGPKAAEISLEPKVGPPTSVVTVHGTSFGRRKNVKITFSQAKVGTATTEQDGSFSTAVMVPAWAMPGHHGLIATGRTSKLRASARFLVRTDWAKFRFDLNNAGFNPYENVVDPSNVSGLQVTWRFTNWTRGSLLARRGGRHRLRGLGPMTGSTRWWATGKELWSCAKGYRVSSSAAVADGVVYVGAGDGKVCALVAATGEKLWSYATGRYVVSSPAVANGAVFVGSIDHSVYALDAATGAKTWSHAAGHAVRSSPAVANGVVYVAAWEGRVCALDAATGAELWRYATGDMVESFPAAANGMVYVGSYDEKVYAFAPCLTVGSKAPPVGAPVKG